MKQKVGVVSSASSSTCDGSDSSVLKIDLETSDEARASPATSSDSSDSSSASGSEPDSSESNSLLRYARALRELLFLYPAGFEDLEDFFFVFSSKLSSFPFFFFFSLASFSHRGHSAM